MPNINLTDSRKRDAVVKAESTGVAEDLRYVDGDGKVAYTRKILKATVAHDFSTLVETCDNDKEKLAQALIEGDPEVDIERCGIYLWGVSKVYVNSEDGIVYRIEQTEVVRDPEGEIKERRPRTRAEANIDIEIPLTWTGRKIDKAEAVRRFVFSSKLQVVHINGLTYDFLFGMASELASSNALMMIGGGSKGRDPLIFRSGSIPYRGFLEGRVDGERYILLLHLSNLELKAPQRNSKSRQAESEKSLEPDGKAPKEKENKDAALPAKAKKAAKPKAAVSSEQSDPSPSNKKKAKKKAKTKTIGNKKANAVATDNKPKAKKKRAARKKTDNTTKPRVEAAELDQLSTEDLGVWLKSVRMGKYLDLFVSNEIDVDVLAELTDDDLKELDIPLGSRRRLLKAVSEADNLRAEVVMAVKTMSGKKVTNK